MSSEQDRECLIEWGNQRAVAGALGASFRRYYRIEDDGSETDFIWGYSGAKNKCGGQGDVLLPFPSRIKDGRYAFEGRTHQLPLNDSAGPNAIHGFLREKIWEFDQTSTAQIRFNYLIRAEEYAAVGYPFTISASMIYALSEDGLSCEIVLRNEGDSAAPVGAGFHPYFVAGTETVDELEAQIPAKRYLEFEPTLVPTGKLIEAEGTPLDFREFKPVGSTVIDNCYADLITDERGYSYSGIRNPATGRSVTVWADDTFPYIVAFTGDTLPPAGFRKALAIEPMTCATDAFNRPDWGLKVLQPGEEFRGRFGVLGTGR